MRIRAAQRDDESLLFGLIGELAEYERLTDAVKGNAYLLAKALFDQKAAEALIAEVDAEAVGYAIFFATFSTFECRSGLWIEDLFVSARPGWSSGKRCDSRVTGCRGLGRDRHARRRDERPSRPGELGWQQ